MTFYNLSLCTNVKPFDPSLKIFLAKNAQLCFYRKETTYFCNSFELHIIMDQLAQHIESLVFVSENPISFKEIKLCLEETFETKFKKPPLEKAIELLKEKYKEEHFSFEFIEIAGGFQFLSKPSFHGTIATYLKQTTKRRLSRAALETLSIIAYKQPVAKSEMEKIRGVSCDYSVQKLLEKELVQSVGRSEGPGRALLYGTSDKFMDYFGLKSLEDMPKPKDFREPDSEIGEQAPIDEVVEATPVDEMPVGAGEVVASEETIVQEGEDEMTTITPIDVINEEATESEEKIEVIENKEEVLQTPVLEEENVTDNPVENIVQESETVQVVENEETDILEEDSEVENSDDTQA